MRSPPFIGKHPVLWSCPRTAAGQGRPPPQANWTRPACSYWFLGSSRCLCRSGARCSSRIVILHPAISAGPWRAFGRRGLAGGCWARRSASIADDDALVGSDSVRPIQTDSTEPTAIIIVLRGDLHRMNGRSFSRPTSRYRKSSGKLSILSEGAAAPAGQGTSEGLKARCRRCTGKLSGRLTRGKEDELGHCCSRCRQTPPARLGAIACFVTSSPCV